MSPILAAIIFFSLIANIEASPCSLQTLNESGPKKACLRKKLAQEYCDLGSGEVRTWSYGEVKCQTKTRQMEDED